MEELKKVLDMMPEAKRSLGLAALGRQTALKTLRKRMSAEGLDPSQLDEELELLKGTKKKPGLFHALDVQEEQKAKKSEPVDPLQTDLEGEPDYRTWELNTDGVRELVAAEISANPAARAIQVLNALEDGENRRQPNPRKTVKDVIRDARKPLIAKVDSIQPETAN